MGQYETASSVAAKTSSTDPYTIFKDHSDGTNNNTGFVLLEGFRNAHPNMHITPFPESEFDIVNWAEAGNAKATLLREDDRFYVQRRFEAPSSRLGESNRSFDGSETRLEGGNEGSLKNRVGYAQYLLDFNGKRYHFYAAEWVYNLFGSVKKMFYLLSPKSEVDEATGSSLVVDELLIDVGKWTSQPHKEIYVFDRGEWTKQSRLWKAIQTSHWEDVILDPDMKQALIDDVQGFFDSRSLYQDYGVPWKRGMIFHGEPGCGKTMSIKALMNSVDKRSDGIASLLVKRFDSTCTGPEDGVQDIFKHARGMAPCLLVFEDLDSLLVDKVRSYFLNEVDGLEDNDGILIIGSTNHLERLDAGITKRPSRFDRKLHFKLPGMQERIMYCEYWRTKLASNAGVDFDQAIPEAVAGMTDSFSFAYLKELMVQSLLTMARGGSKAKLSNGEVASKVMNGETDSLNGTDEEAEVSIPEHLVANPFMQVLQAQTVVLRRDMKSVEAEEQKASEREQKPAETHAAADKQ